MSDASDLFRRLRVKIQNLVQRGVVTVTGPSRRYQGKHVGGRVSDDLENFQPQGLHFRVPPGAEYVQVHPGAIQENAVMLGAHVRNTLPEDAIPEGTGGLHYLGEFAVYIDEDGVVHLGGGVSAAEFVALAPKINDYFTKLDTLFRGMTGTTPLTPTALAGLYTAAVATAPTSVAASKVKAT